MAATPNELDYFLRGEPFPGLQGKVDNTGFDYFLRAEALQPMVQVAAVDTSFVPRIMVYT